MGIVNDAFAIEKREVLKMRRKDPALMERINDFIGSFYREEHETPSLREIAEGVGIAKTTAHSYLVEMNEKKMLIYNGHSISNKAIERCKTGYFSAPVVGSIHCGDPETEEQYVEEYVSLPQSIFGKGQMYVLKAVGDSMEDAGISEGDYVVISRKQECSEGDIVVALDGDGQNTLKRFGGIDEKSGCAILEYENREVYGDKVILVKELVIQGVASHVIKAL